VGVEHKAILARSLRPRIHAAQRDRDGNRREPKKNISSFHIPFISMNPRTK
jgi:hypothetical protein